MNTYKLNIPNTPYALDVFEFKNGKGPHCLITAGVHGAEDTSILAALKLIHSLPEEDIKGTITLVPVCNPSAFYHFSKQVVPEDQQNLNRVFPGSLEGSLSSKLAYIIEHELVRPCDYHVDLHGGDVHEAVMPFVYYVGMADEAVVAKAKALAEALDVEVIVKSGSTSGAYNYSGVIGKPSILVERGGAYVKSDDIVNAYYEDLLALLSSLGILSSHHKAPSKKPIDIHRAKYPLAEACGMWYPQLKVGDRFRQGDCLGLIKDIFGNVLQSIEAEGEGIILYQVQTLGIYSGSETIAYGLFD